MEPNELDQLYSDLRHNRARSKRDESSIHVRIRELKGRGMEATTDPICANGDCGAVVGGWGQECGVCLGSEYPAN